MRIKPDILSNNEARSHIINFSQKDGEINHEIRAYRVKRDIFPEIQKWNNIFVGLQD